ncbi:MAG: indolepyruvate ferredoxin oxidoreductase family protein [Alphaproteobacteria bacterium]
MALKPVSLDDKFDLSVTRVFVNGPQAVVRMMLMQKARDQAAGHNTAGYVTGYRGSPLGGIDQQMARSAKELTASNILFQPGVNEDLAATALWGTQQAQVRGEGKYDGVFGLWYGKGPGVDRSGDVFRHANFAGTSPLGGVLALMGDDHTCESSTSAHQSEFAMMDAMIPILSPAGLQELVDYGIYGYAMSRFSGCWVGLKAVKDTIEITAAINADPHEIDIAIPQDFEMPEGGLSIRAYEHALVQEARLHDYKRFAATAFARVNRLDKIIMAGGPAPRIGIATLGKSYLDTAQALATLGIDEVRAADLGLRLSKIAMPWPLEPEGVERFADGLDLIIVVEEKRSLIETQLREQLYGRANAPAIIGKRDEKGDQLLPAKGALEANQIALVIGERLMARAPNEALAARLAQVQNQVSNVANAPTDVVRIPYYCAGCPHNTSTKIPQGTRAYAGIGCHYMVQWMDRDTQGFTQMGGEGANWIGEAPFSTRSHVFQNLGDGTYNHSGILAIRAAIYSGVNITYKILYNDAVAMTGGQPNEGELSVAAIANQVIALGANRLVIVTDEPDKYPTNSGFPPATTIYHRDDLMEVQKELSHVTGVSVMIYDQTCAAEKRRRRKRGLYPDPAKRVVINELVCEGCGDCGVKSNCVAIVPVETDFGRKRAIHQSSCNKDYSCVDGFCPSFVTVHGGRLKSGKTGALTALTALTAGLADFSTLPAPQVKSCATPYSIVITGIGGTGVVTIGALLGMAAHLEGKGCGVLDMAGLAQKGGAVTSHLRIALAPQDIKAVRVEAGGADLILGCDLVTTGSTAVLATMAPKRTRAVVNIKQTMTADFLTNPDMKLPTDLLSLAITARVGEGSAWFVNAGRLATALLGDAIASNLFMLGIAAQKGLLPVSVEALTQAIKLNGVAVEMNLSAFMWGRRAGADQASVEVLVAPAPGVAKAEPQGLAALVDHRAAFLTDYQNQALAEKFRALVDTAQKAEHAKAGGRTGFAEAVARSYFKVLAYKDEYEVARLFTDGSFRRQVEAEFEGDYRLEFHLAPPALKGTSGGAPKKRRFGPWMMTAFKVLAKFKGLRGTWADPFGHTGERAQERQMITGFETMITQLCADLTPQNFAICLELAGLAQTVRGFGHVKQKSLAQAARRRDLLLAKLGHHNQGARTAA